MGISRPVAVAVSFPLTHHKHKVILKARRRSAVEGWRRHFQKILEKLMKGQAATDSRQAVIHYHHIFFQSSRRKEVQITERNTEFMVSHGWRRRAVSKAPYFRSSRVTARSKIWSWPCVLEPSPEGSHAVFLQLSGIDTQQFWLLVKFGDLAWSLILIFIPREKCQRNLETQYRLPGGRGGSKVNFGTWEIEIAAGLETQRWTF